MTFKNVICPACGACCDDIQIDFNGNRMIVKNACKIGNAKFQGVACDNRIREPLIRERGEFKKVQWNDALQKASQILADAKRPLIFMGGDIACEAMEVGLQLGEFLGAR